MTTLYKGNSNFIEPNDFDTSVWRYMDLAKFNSLIETNKLYLPRADCFSDKYECSFPLRNVKIHKTRESEGSSSFMGDENARAKLKKSYYLSSWRLDNYESDAMWRLYCPSGIGVAIKTSYLKLRNSIPNNCYIGMINYIDYKTSKFGDEDRLAPIMNKRRSFSFENEVRILLPEREFWISDPDKNHEIVKYINFNFCSIISEVVVSPYADQSYFNLVSNLLQITQVACNWSEMKEDPTY